MKCFGYEKTEEKSLLEMKEVTFQASPSDLRRLAGFLTSCAHDMEKDPNWEHEHLSDYSPNHSSELDVIVFRGN